MFHWETLLSSPREILRSNCSWGTKPKWSAKPGTSSPAWQVLLENHQSKCWSRHSVAVAELDRAQRGCVVFDPSNNALCLLGPISVVFQIKEPQGISWATVNSYFVMELISVMAEKWRLLKIWHLEHSLTPMDWRAQRRHQIKNDTIGKKKKYPGTFFSFENHHLDFFHAHKKNSGMQSNTCAQPPVKLLRFMCLVKGK